MSVGLMIVVLGGAVVVALLLLVLARRREGGWWKDPGRAGGVLGAARSPFAVILAFVIFIAFQSFNDAKRGAQDEAAATRTLFKTADLLTPETRAKLQANLICYARAVIHLDWPAMSDGGSSRRVDDVAGSLDDDLRELKVTDDLQKGALSQIFDESNARERGRSARLSEAEGRVPDPVWVVIVLGAIGVLAYVLLFADPAEKLMPQAVMVASVTVIVVGGLMLVWFLSHPFRHEAGSIEPTAMRRTLIEIEHDPSFAEGGLPVVCDLQGRPL